MWPPSSGTASFPARYEYGQEVDGSYRVAYSEEIKLDSSYGDTLEWTKTCSDGAALLTSPIATVGAKLI